MKILIIIIYSFAFSVFNLGISFSQPLENIKYGPHKIVLKIFNTVDESRTFPANADTNAKTKPSSRPIKIYIWYPAKNNSVSKKLLFENYADMMAQDFGVESINMSDRIDTLIKYFGPFRKTPKEELQKIIKSETQTYFEAPMKTGSFPLIVFGQGYGYESPDINYALCEYLASYGFIVAASPLVGTNSPSPGVNLLDLETEVCDMNFVINEMKKSSNVNKNKIAILGFDLGGMASMLLQIQNKDIKAMVSLDSGIMFEHNTKTLKESPIYDPSKLRIPLLHFISVKEDLVKWGVTEDYSLIQKSKKVDRYIVRFKDIHHRDFTSLSRLGLSDGSSMSEEIRTEHEKKYNTICDYTLLFLNSYLKNDTKSKVQLNSKSEIVYPIFEHYRIDD